LASEDGRNHYQRRNCQPYPVNEFLRPKVSFPGLSEQATIADILSAYDDLIENNRRRIALLEEAARMFYREWFVHFRFPGHEHVKITDGLPEGWENLELGRLCSLRAGRVFKPKYQGNLSGDFPFIKVRDMNSPGNLIIITEADNWVTSDACEEFRGRPFPSGTSVFAKIGEALRQNRLRFLVRETSIDNNMMGAVPSRELVEGTFLYYMLSTYDLANHASWAAVLFLSAKVLSQIRFLVPPPTVQQHFSDVAAPAFQQIAILQRQNREAAKTRDLLLPRLMNGEIAV
jgi:type I restriction enzyme, S subunit